MGLCVTYVHTCEDTSLSAALCSEIMHFDDRGTQENQTQRQHLSIFCIKDIIQLLKISYSDRGKLLFNLKTQDRRTCPVSLQARR